MPLSSAHNALIPHKK